MTQLQMPRVPFHLAFPVTNLEAIRAFYTHVLGCQVGRETASWIDFDFFGHQITAHLDETYVNNGGFNQVDQKPIPARHFGAILLWEQWDRLVEHIKSNNIAFYVNPYTRFEGETGEQRTFFIQDPCDNYLEFKCFKDNACIFQKTV